jgi:hypothetical protein
LQSGYCFNGFCQCGFGWHGNATNLDPRACAPVCVPPPLLDAIAFLNEPNITAEALDGQMVVTISVLPYLKQRPISISMMNPITDNRCNILPGLLGTCELLQVLDPVSCSTDYIWTHSFYDVVLNSNCFVELPSVTEVGPGFTIYSRSFQTVFEVVLSGLAPFGLEAGYGNATSGVPTGEVLLTRTVRRYYTFSVATKMDLASQDFLSLASGALLYRLVGIDVQPQLSRVVVTIQTRVAKGGRVSP